MDPLMMPADGFGDLLCCALRRGIAVNNQRLARTLSEWGGPCTEAQILEALNLAAFGVQEPMELPPLAGTKPPWRDVAPKARVPFAHLAEPDRARWVGRVALELRSWSRNPTAFLAQYADRPDTAGGRIVSGDTVLYMLEASQENAPVALAAVRELELESVMDLRILALRLWDQALDMAAPHPILLMAGGQGSGKTTTARQITELGWPGAIVDAPWVVERDIRAVRNRGLDPWIVFVDRPFEGAFISMIYRAADEGRIVDPPDMARNHALIPGKLHRDASLFRNQPRVSVWHLMNTTPATTRAVGGPLHRDGKEALVSIHNRKEMRTQAELEATATGIWRAFQDSIAQGKQNAYPRDLAWEIERV